MVNSYPSALFSIMRSCSQRMLATRAFGSPPFDENLAYLASFVSLGIVTASPILCRLVPFTDVLANHSLDWVYGILFDCIFTSWLTWLSHTFCFRNRINLGKFQRYAILRRIFVSFMRRNGDSFYAIATARTPVHRKIAHDSGSTPKARIAYQELWFWHGGRSINSVN